MIDFRESVADAYVRPARNVSMPSTPGRTVRFLQGHATIKNGRDLVAMLRRPGIKLVLTPYGLSWMDTWFKEAGQIKAEVMIPESPPRVGWDASLKDDVRGPDSARADT